MRPCSKPSDFSKSSVAASDQVKTMSAKVSHRMRFRIGYDFDVARRRQSMPDIAVYLDIDGDPERLGSDCGRGTVAKLASLNTMSTGCRTQSDSPSSRHSRSRPESFPEPRITACQDRSEIPRRIRGDAGMLRAERRRAELERRTPRTLFESAYLLGVADPTRMGALRFCISGSREFMSPLPDGVPSLVSLGKLLSATERVLRDDETDEDFRLLFAPGSSLGGARPKASVIDRSGKLTIAKFPKENDDYSIETWEEIALRLADRAGIKTAEHKLINVLGRSVLLSRRFDRAGEYRIPFLSAMSMLEMVDGERGSYPEIADALIRHGSQTKVDVRELYKRMTLNVLISNVDDHLRNHGFLWRGRNGWSLSPAYDVNPTPVDKRPRILTTNINLDEGTCSLDLLFEVAGYFDLKLVEAKTIVRDVGVAVATWREVASSVGARAAEIDRMASAFEHTDLVRARALSS